MAVLGLIVLLSLDTFFTGFLLASYRRLERTVAVLGSIQVDSAKHQIDD